MLGSDERRACDFQRRQYLAKGRLDVALPDGLYFAIAFGRTSASCGRREPADRFRPTPSSLDLVSSLGRPLTSICWKHNYREFQTKRSIRDVHELEEPAEGMPSPRRGLGRAGRACRKVSRPHCDLLRTADAAKSLAWLF
jgi:hypothetical protein